MSSLREKLAALGHQASLAPRPDEAEAAGRGLATLLGAAEQRCESGAVLVRTTRVPLGEPWGEGTLARPSFGSVLSAYVGGGLGSIRDPDTVYLDTETTGLTGGSGTYAFLIGVGRFSSDAFVLRQLFLRGPWEERALLAIASSLLTGAAAVVSYNGKSFDVPLLRSRFAYHGLPDPLRCTPHVDLLHISRRLWRERLATCTLGDVEQGALGMGRGGDDVPGRLIPELYFSFLRSGDVAPLRDVMRHNELDICSLAALLARVDDLLEGRVDAARLPLADAVSLARTWEALGRSREALALLAAAAQRQGARGADAELVCAAHLRAGRVAKRLGRHADAARHWREVAGSAAAGALGIDAMVELAKLSEHHERDLPGALRWVERCLDDLGMADRWQRERLSASLAHRRARLLRKLDAPQDRLRASRQPFSS